MQETTRIHQRSLPRYLRRLEAESIEITREVVAGFAKPVMLYSMGKDSSVMLHLAVKAFYPANLPFPLMHVDTTWKFREMVAFRDENGHAARGRTDRSCQSGRHQARH
jgi:sulfate adenylyltransferase subunit 2